MDEPFVCPQCWTVAALEPQKRCGRCGRPFGSYFAAVVVNVVAGDDGVQRCTDCATAELRMALREGGCSWRCPTCGERLT